MYGLYGALLRLAWAAVLPYQIVIRRWTGAAASPWRERLGHAPAPAGASHGGLWLHAVSVGEVRLALSLVPALRRVLPGRALHLTTVTATGRALAASPARAGEAPDSLSCFPFDLPRSMGRLLDRLRPAGVLLLETEIWPNLLRLCGRRGVPVLLVNGRISPRAFPRYRAVRPFLRRVLDDVRLFAMQSSEDAERIAALGAPRDRIRVTGNLKFDVPPPEVNVPAMRRRLGFAESDPIFIAGSTAPGEEAHVIEALRAVRETHPRSRLVLVPRHPEDAARAVAALGRAGLRAARWQAADRAGCDALVVDAVGYLAGLYAAADVVFVGGSFSRRGGQNLMEPAALGKPVLFGPNVQNFAAAARSLREAGGGFVVRDGRDLGRRASAFLADRPLAARAGKAALRVVEAHRGALDRTVALIAGVLDRPAGAGILPAARP